MNTKNVTFRILLALIFFSSIAVTPVYARHNEVQLFEGEIRGGITSPLEEYHNGKARISGSFGIEGRFNFKNQPWDCGISLDFSTARRSYERFSEDGHWLWQNNRTLAISALSDYNFRQGNKINPFIGATFGVAINDVVGDNVFPSSGISVIFAPRVGVELIHHFRVMAQFNLCRKGYNNFSFTLGFVFGGRPKFHSYPN